MFFQSFLAVTSTESPSYGIFMLVFFALGFFILYLLVKAVADHVLNKPQPKSPPKTTTATRIRFQVPLKTIDELRNLAAVVRSDSEQQLLDVYEDYEDRFNNVIYNGGVMGKPGSRISHAKNFSDGNIHAGIKGEVKIGGILEAFVKSQTETLHLFHSVGWPAHVRTNADIDHILVYGSNILIIDSKNWESNSTYAFNYSGSITKNGKTMPYALVPSVFGAWEEMVISLRRHYSHLKIETVTCIYGKNIIIQNNQFGKLHHLTSDRQLTFFLQGWLDDKQAKTPPHTELIRSLTSLF